MGYKHISPQVKLRVLKSYWASHNLAKTARDYGVGRNAIYEWVQIAEQTLVEAFKNKTPGKRNLISLDEQNENLKQQLDELLDVYHKTSQDTEIPSEVTFCPECHSDNICKNGRVFTKSHGIRQRLICRSCSFSIYVALKKTPRSSA